MSIFVIPMVGMSSRFFSAGYQKPKYQLDINGITMFEWSVRSFEKFFDHEKFLFIVRDIYDTPSFVKEEVEKMQILHYDIIILNDMTSGQAETVYLGLLQANIPLDNEIFIFNIDSKLKNFFIPDWYRSCDGYLEVFEGHGDHWSFVKVNEEGDVLCTAEKNRISNLCSNGLYYFSSVSVFNMCYLDSIYNNKKTKGEVYVAPLYNYLIEQNFKIKINLVDYESTLFCGTPDEYDYLTGYKR